MVKNPPANAGYAGNAGYIPGLGRSPGGRNGNPVQHSCLENLLDRGAWWATVHEVAELHPTERLSTHAHRGKEYPLRCVKYLELLGSHLPLRDKSLLAQVQGQRRVRVR